MNKDIANQQISGPMISNMLFIKVNIIQPVIISEPGVLVGLLQGFYEFVLMLNGSGG